MTNIRIFFDMVHTADWPGQPEKANWSRKHGASDAATVQLLTFRRKGWRQESLAEFSKWV